MWSSCGRSLIAKPTLSSLQTKQHLGMQPTPEALGHCFNRFGAVGKSPSRVITSSSETWCTSQGTLAPRDFHSMHKFIMFELVSRSALQSRKTDCMPSEAEICKWVSFVRIKFCHSYSLPSDSGNRSLTSEERLGVFKTIFISLG